MFTDGNVDDLWDRIGKDLFAKKVENCMKQNIPIPFVLPSFPFKSSNTRNKVISEHADMAEKLALNNINSFCEDIKKIYPPGASFVIVSDGRVYNSQFEISLPNVLLFQREVLYSTFNDINEVLFSW